MGGLLPFPFTIVVTSKATMGAAVGILLHAFLISPLAPAAIVDSEQITNMNLDGVLPPNAVRTVLKTFGSLTDHRSYEGAVALGNPGVDLGVEAVLVHTPANFGAALSEMGMGGASNSMSAALPMMKLHLNKGLGEKVDIGLSGMYYPGSYIWGGDLKFVIIQPEEGMTWAVRIGYSVTKFDAARLGLPAIPISVNGIDLGTINLILRTRGVTPQVVGSLRLDFAEPYLGAGVQWLTGHMDVPVNIRLTNEQQMISTSVYHSMGGFAFMGLSIRPPRTGLRLAFEGSYNTLGMHHLGVVTGFGF